MLTLERAFRCLNYLGGLFTVSLTCSANLKVGGFVGSVAHGFNSRAFHCDFRGVSKRLVHVDFKWTFGDLLACKQDGHLRERNKNHPRRKCQKHILKEVRGTCLVRPDNLRNVGDTERLLALIRFRFQLHRTHRCYF